MGGLRLGRHSQSHQQQESKSTSEDLLLSSRPGRLDLSSRQVTASDFTLAIITFLFSLQLVPAAGPRSDGHGPLPGRLLVPCPACVTVCVTVLGKRGVLAQAWESVSIQPDRRQKSCRAARRRRKRRAHAAAARSAAARGGLVMDPAGRRPADGSLLFSCCGMACNSTPASCQWSADSTAFFGSISPDDVAQATPRWTRLGGTGPLNSAVITPDWLSPPAIARSFCWSGCCSSRGPWPRTMAG
jgi:hypothetical protein